MPAFLEKKRKPFFVDSLNSFSLFPAFAAGIKDSINPVAIIGVLCLTIFVISLSHQKKHILLSVCVFIATVWFMTLAFTIGIFDRWISSVQVQVALQNIFLVFGSIFILLGLISLYDWWLMTRYGSGAKVFIRWPKISLSPRESGFGQRFPKEEKAAGIKYVLGAILAAATLAIVETIWPPNYSLGPIYAKLGLPETQPMALLAFCFYSFAFILPLILATVILFYFFQTGKFMPWMEKSFSKVKIISSAVFLSIGVSILYIFY